MLINDKYYLQETVLTKQKKKKKQPDGCKEINNRYSTGSDRNMRRPPSTIVKINYEISPQAQNKKGKLLLTAPGKGIAWKRIYTSASLPAAVRYL